MTRAMLVIEKLYAEQGSAPPFFLVGHSMGGLVAAVASVDPLMPHGPWLLSQLAPPLADSLFVAAGLVGAVVTLATPLVTSPWLGQVRLTKRNTGWN